MDVPTQELKDYLRFQQSLMNLMTAPHATERSTLVWEAELADENCFPDRQRH